MRDKKSGLYIKNMDMRCVVVRYDLLGGVLLRNNSLPKYLFGIINFVNLFYYLVYFSYYSWVPLHFLILFMSFTILF